MATWVGVIVAGLGVLMKLLDLFKTARETQAIKTEQERDALARQVAEGKQANAIDDSVRLGDIDALRDSMRKYQRPDAS